MPPPRFARRRHEAPEDLASWFARSARSLVRPPLVRRRDLRALVLDGYATQRIVLALRVALPVVRHENPGQVRVAVEDHPEHVVRLPLLPVGGRVDAGDAGHI